MLRPRIIPCLLLRNGALTKTIQFGEGRYIGDPLNAVRIFNEKEADELIVIDIDATVRGQSPNFELIGQIARECRMPLCYGGGVKSLEQAKRLISLGAEKIAIGAGIFEYPELIENIVGEIGSQSVIAVVDVKKRTFRSKYEVFIRNARVNTGSCPIQIAEDLERRGVGELLINSIDRDGLMTGYDLPLISQIREKTSMPLIALGGAGNQDHFTELFSQNVCTAAAAGSVFVFKGNYKAVLINYPNITERDSILRTP